MTIRVLDPSSEMVAALSEAAPRLETFDGMTVGFISNGKEGTNGFFSHLGQMLKEDYGVSDVITRVKSNYSAPADAAIVNEITRWDAVISGIGD